MWRKGDEPLAAAVRSDGKFAVAVVSRNNALIVMDGP